VRRSRFGWSLALLVACASASQPAHGQQPPASRDTTFETGITAGEADGERRRRQLLNRAQFDLGFITMGVGGGLLYDVAAYSPDSASEQYFRLDSELRLRDARLLFGGRVKTKRRITWQLGLMYDRPTNNWLFRQTGIMVAVPEIWSHFFVGRAKEGFSMNKVMVGYDGWSMERLPFTDATIPLLADGVKWLGHVPSLHMFWNAGWFTDVVSKGQTFSSYDNQIVLRTGWVPMVSDSVGTLLHVAANLRHGTPDKHQLQLRSKPESFLAPYFIDTGRFPARSSSQAGFEIYYRPGSLLLGAEYSWQMVDSPENGDPTFHGGEAVITWLPTGETRSYNLVGNYFRAVSPTRTVIQGGPGAWETVLKFSYSDLTSKTLQGGVFWRITPMINWHLTDNVRLEFAFGYGKLDRWGARSVTQFFQSRLQMQL
jgi:phosphate-selective porin OprO/OprP